MTLPAERTRAVLRMEALVAQLLGHAFGTGKTAKVPRELVRSLLDSLRHYPTRGDLRRSHDALPDVWGEP